METRLEAMEQQVFKCQGMVECGLTANHMMITEFTNKHRIDANDIGKHLSRLYDRVDQLQGQIYDLHNQNSVDKHASDRLCQWFRSTRAAAGLSNTMMQGGLGHLARGRGTSGADHCSSREDVG
ncbi:40s ribosomal protein s5-1 [Hordeum vulgare]|nr:40s ribosomal protein s5-1 [Hordeum vulgare]